MITELPPTVEDGVVARRSRPRPFGILKDLDHPGDVFRDLGPNWFATIMGTGIVANAAATLPFRVAGLHVFALAVWVLAAGFLVLLTAAWAVHWSRHRQRALAHANNPVMAQFWGAPAMALMTVGTGTLLLGREWIGLAAAVDADWALWGLGTALGLVTACWIPYLMMTRHTIEADSAFGGWLMPVVPPMVSAANGALLIPYAAAGQARLTLLLGCYAMFGISLFASVIIISLVWSRLVTYKTLPAVMVPTSWIVLGPLGQSVTATGNLAREASLVLPPPYPAGANVFALLYGLPTWGFAMLWLAIAAALTVRALRRGLPFGLTWWSFTFPVGTVVTGTISLAGRTGSDVFRDASGVLFLLLVAAWLVVAARTGYESARGRLFLPPAPGLADQESASRPLHARTADGHAARPRRRSLLTRSRPSPISLAPSNSPQMAAVSGACGGHMPSRGRGSFPGKTARLRRAVFPGRFLGGQWMMKVTTMPIAAWGAWGGWRSGT